MEGFKTSLQTQGDEGKGGILCVQYTGKTKVESVDLNQKGENFRREFLINLSKHRLLFPDTKTFKTDFLRATTRCEYGFQVSCMCFIGRILVTETLTFKTTLFK